MRLMFGEIFIDNFIINFLPNVTVKEFFHWSLFVEIVDKSLMSCFLIHCLLPWRIRYSLCLTVRRCKQRHQLSAIHFVFDRTSAVRNRIHFDMLKN